MQHVYGDFNDLDGLLPRLLRLPTTRGSPACNGTTAASRRTSSPTTTQSSFRRMVTAVNWSIGTTCVTVSAI